MNPKNTSRLRSAFIACTAFVLCAAQPVSAAVTSIFLKADDMVAYGGTTSSSPAYMSTGWKAFLQMLNDKNIVANVGIIGASCDRAYDTKFWSDLKALTSTRIELFNHGYTHQDGGYKATHPGDAVWQKADLVKNQNLVKAKIGITMTAVGLPGNADDSASVTAINAITDLKRWMFANTSGTTKTRIYRDGNLESTPGTLFTYAQFVANYPTYIANANAAGRNYLCLQLHPHLHSTTEQATLAQIVDFLKGKGLTFHRLTYF
jgi:hypothetical protein